MGRTTRATGPAPRRVAIASGHRGVWGHRSMSAAAGRGALGRRTAARACATDARPASRSPVGTGRGRGVEPAPDRAEPATVGLVDQRGAETLRPHEAGVTKDAQVGRERRIGDRKKAGELAHGHRLRGETIQNDSPPPMGDCAEHIGTIGRLEMGSGHGTIFVENRSLSTEHKSCITADHAGPAGRVMADPARCVAPGPWGSRRAERAVVVAPGPRIASCGAAVGRSSDRGFRPTLGAIAVRAITRNARPTGRLGCPGIAAPARRHVSPASAHPDAGPRPRRAPAAPTRVALAALEGGMPSWRQTPMAAVSRGSPR